LFAKFQQHAVHAYLDVNSDTFSRSSYKKILIEIDKSGDFVERSVSARRVNGCGRGVQGMARLERWQFKIVVRDVRAPRRGTKFVRVWSINCLKCHASCLIVIALAASLRADGVPADDARQAFVMREAMHAGTATRVQIELKAQGLYRPGLVPGVAEAQMPKPRELDVQTRLVFHERIVRAEPGGKVNSSGGSSAGAGDGSSEAGSLKVVRHVVQAVSAINGEVRPTAASLRREVALLMAEKRDRGWPVVVFSPAGPLTWSELELVQGVGDPLALPDLLPAIPVAVGDRWKVGDAAAKGVSGYDTITANQLEATLESADARQARIRLKGRIEGSAFGGTGVIGCEGFAFFDRDLARIHHLDLNRVETRQPGPVEAGLDLKSTLTVARHPALPAEALTDVALAGVSLDHGNESELLRMTAPGKKATLLADRDWHIFWEDSKMAIWKRLESGRVIAQCNLMLGPTAAKGHHQDPAQFRDDIRRGLKSRFVQFLGAGEVGGHPDGGFRYKLGVQGREGDIGVIWYYYLLASNGGDQLLATFTLAEDHLKIFGDRDLELISSLRWLPPH
jgi:hypothetical protein